MRHYETFKLTPVGVVLLFDSVVASVEGMEQKVAVVLIEN